MPDCLAVCMIVRNEEAVLPRCLESLQGLEARLYITDTGSTDRTAEIARDHGAEVRNFPWDDDFSAARNHSISRVAEEWILNLDADDWFPPGEAARIPAFLDRSDRSALALSYEVEPGSTPARACKIIRNHRGIRFEGIIHEAFRRSLARLGPGAVGEIPVLLRHAGYNAATVERKARRNFPLLLREWERCRAAADWAQTLYVGKKLSEAHFARGESGQAETILCRLLRQMIERGKRVDSDWEVTLATHLISHYHDQNRDQAAAECCRECEPVFGGHPLFRLYRGITRLRNQEFDLALEDFNRFEIALARSELVGLAIPRSLIGPEFWNYQGICLEALGHSRAAAAVFAKAVQMNPDNPEYQARLQLASRIHDHGLTLDFSTVAQS